ncbi:type VII secretion system-associated protein [Actinoalloteichus sp. GBA129-24]|uniref:type VII secretion system-associated protein n=1 Tax=Actinoalloteichus sp. GBA129-24 TaxID=1612551 RepID=UPI0009505D99|nr:type VII secretion system-associated protein [Actinoalloteichus sp. GBA129-24]APU23051.1 hypothetical protein UA75_25365 [Actinoalloteichus sp. GBA129-24]
MNDHRPETTANDRQNWVVLTSPEWRRRDDTTAPPPEAIVGAWPLGVGEGVGLFEPNPGYQPSGPEVPTDPVDAAIRLALTGDVTASDQIVPLLWNAVLEVPVAQDGSPLVAAAPDGVPCVVVATAAVNRARIEAPLWRRVSAAELVGLLPAATDVLINPDGPAAMRLLADIFRDGPPPDAEPAGPGITDRLGM